MKSKVMMKMLDEEKMRTQPGQAVSEKEAKAAYNPYAKFETEREGGLEEAILKMAEKNLDKIQRERLKFDHEMSDEEAKEMNKSYKKKGK